MSRLVIAEKPSVAQSIASVLGAVNRKDGYLEGGGYLVSWCFGHLAELSDASAYNPDYAKWRYEDLPILPEKWQYSVAADKKKQFDLLKKLMESLLKIMKEHVHTYMPGFTHLQKAQPVTLAHHVGAYFEMFKRDRGRLTDIRKRMNTCPLGAGALAGTTYPLDRDYTAELLDFDGPTLKSMD